MTASKRLSIKRLVAGLACAGALVAATGQAQAAATLVINNINGPGVGFNDPTPALPVGGNSGTTLGEQRFIAFGHALNLWGATLNSNQPIIINAQFSALTCTATAAVLGSAGATSVFRDFANAPKAATWYPYALANKISGAYLGTLNAPQISANFNVNLGQSNCLTGTFFYWGLDGNHGTHIDFVAVLQHELAHALGFVTFTNGNTGVQFGGSPSIWDHFLFGTTASKLWKDMTDAERAASAISGDKLVWTGANVNGAVPFVLRPSIAALSISGPAAGAAAGIYAVGEATFGTALGNPPVSSQIMPVVDQPNGTGLACLALSAINRLAVRGNIGLVNRGTCADTVKVKNLQDAGAIAVLVADNVVDLPPPGLVGTDATITIPSVLISQADGITIKSRLGTRSRTASGVVGSLGFAGNQYAGADALGRALMFAPNPFQSGSSVSHWSPSMRPNQLMEPSINADLTQSVIPPFDLTFRLLQDIGW